MQLFSCLHRNGFILGIIACFLLAGIPVVMAADGTTASLSPGGNISVLTNPLGAEVYLNGEYRGITPIKMEHLSPGTYIVDIRMNGFRNETFQRTLNEGSMVEAG
jgi:hypothetical protein